MNNRNNEPEYDSFTIPGTHIALPILLLRGKRYMEVAQRLVWFNHEKDTWIIETEVEAESKDFVRFKAIIKNPEGKVMRVARKSKIIKDIKDYESCETGAIGRALALMGYGTQFAVDDISEGDDLSDAPVVKAPVKQLVMDSAIAGMSKEKAVSGVYTGKTFEEIFKEDSKQGFKWTIKRMEEDGTDIILPDWCIHYLEFAETMGVKI